MLRVEEINLRFFYFALRRYPPDLAGAHQTELARPIFLDKNAVKLLRPVQVYIVLSFLLLIVSFVVVRREDRFVELIISSIELDV